MQEQFKEYYDYTEKEKQKIRMKGVFVFDANVLLNLYRYKVGTSKQFIATLKKLADKNTLWLPHQALHEYHKNRKDVIIELEKKYSQAKSTITESIEKVKDVSGKIKGICDKHPLLDYNEIEHQIDSNLQTIIDSIEKLKGSHPNRRNNDVILKDIENLFTEYGKPYSPVQINKLMTDGKSRYEKKIPPGYEDDQKDDKDKYGDFILWSEIMDYAKLTKKPIIFVTDDQKEDRWEKTHGETIGPRYELKKEFFTRTKQDFLMYRPEEFLQYASNYTKTKVDPQMFKEIQLMRNRIVHEQEEGFETLKGAVPEISELLFLQNRIYKEIELFVIKEGLNAALLEYFLLNIQNYIRKYLKSISEKDNEDDSSFEVDDIVIEIKRFEGLFLRELTNSGHEFTSLGKGPSRSRIIQMHLRRLIFLLRRCSNSILLNTSSGFNEIDKIES